MWRFICSAKSGEWFGAGTFARLDQQASAQIDDDVIRRGDYTNWARTEKVRKLRVKGWRSVVYELLGHSTKPRLIGNNVGIWRTDYERINGYDENFVGWGWEDDDLGNRLRRAGVRIRSMLRWTNTYHLWHPTDGGKRARNNAYMRRKGVLTRCRNGLAKTKFWRFAIACDWQPAAATSLHSSCLP